MAQDAPNIVQKRLLQMVEDSGKSEDAIAEEAGIPKPSLISMMIQGFVKVPISVAPKLAAACGCDPAAFTRIVMEVQEPLAWAALESTFGEALNSDERELVATYREVIWPDPPGPGAVVVNCRFHVHRNGLPSLSDRPADPEVGPRKHFKVHIEEVQPWPD